jgi:hypothetical protein
VQKAFTNYRAPKRKRELDEKIEEKEKGLVDYSRVVLRYVR